MGFGSFDQANLDAVAYAQVLPDGTSPLCNSGVTTSHVGTGQYRITLPSNLAQDASRTFACVSQSAAPLMIRVHKLSDVEIDVYFYANNNAPTDTSFDIVILRTMVPPPAGAPA